MSPDKEPSFFSHDDRYARGWSWYEDLFKAGKGKQSIGEASNSYSACGIYPNTARRIAEGLPEARLIYITRNPLTRAESDWMSSRRVDMAGPKLSFAQFLREDPIYLDKSLYWKQINAYRAFFSDERILVLFFEDFRSDPEETMRACLRFLGVDCTVRIDQAAQPWRPSDRYRVDRALLTNLRRLSVFDALRHRVPRALKQALKPVFQKEFSQARPVWDRESREWFLSQIAADSHAFLGFYGKRRDFWGF
jgi:hypothetical protein